MIRARIQHRHRVLGADLRIAGLAAIVCGMLLVAISNANPIGMIIGPVCGYVIGLILTLREPDLVDISPCAGWHPPAPIQEDGLTWYRL